MKRYKFIMPTPERCKELGIKFEGLAVSTQLWLMGVSSGVAALEGKDRFNLFLAGRNCFDVDTNSEKVLFVVTDRMEQYGFTRELVSDTRSVSFAQGSAIPHNHTASWAAKA